MKKSGRLELLKSIHKKGQISRVGLAEETGFSRSYISTIIQELVDSGHLVEKGLAESSGGRRRVLLEINPDIAHLIGVDIGTANVRVVVTDMLGTVISKAKFPTRISTGMKKVLSRVFDEMRLAFRDDGNIRGIGISQSGVIDSESGAVLFWPKVPGWKDVPLKQLVEDEFHVPAFVEDSGRAMAIAEQRFGGGRNVSCFFHVCVGMGIGASIFTEGKLYIGHKGLAGELGHITIDEHGELCTCGNRGCLEVYASGFAIIKKARSGVEQGVTSVLSEIEPDDLSVEAIVEAARGGDRLANTVLSEAGSHLGTALADIVNLLNPEKIILGAAVPQVAGDVLMDPLLRTVKERAFPQSVEDLVIEVSTLGDEAAAVGAAVIAAERVLETLFWNRETEELELR